ncbi:MAG: HTH domain-containing protein [Nakamurella sp.]
MSAASRDNYLTLRRVERQQRIVELLGTAGEPMTSGALAIQLGAGVRTVERDLARLRDSGVPIETVAGVHGGSRIVANLQPRPLTLTFAETAALISSLTALGPTATGSAESAMQALVSSLSPDRDLNA